MKAALTERQREILDFIRTHIAAHGYPPSVRDIGSAHGIRSTNGVMDHLNRLVTKGYLQREALKSRGMRLTEGLPPKVEQTPQDRAAQDLSRVVEDYLRDPQPHKLSDLRRYHAAYALLCPRAEAA